MIQYKGLIPEIEIKMRRGAVKKMQIKGSADAAEAFRYFFDEDTLDLYEQVMVIFLSRNLTTIGWYKVSQGGIAGAVIDPRLIFGTALKVAACSLMICHNHPSGNLEVSDADKKITRQIKQIGEFHDIRLLDHLIITSDGYVSMSDEGCM